MNTSIKPVASSERAEILDVLRGIAILGIFLANSANFSLYVFQTDELKAGLPTAAFDEVLKYISSALISGKFYSLFSLLFGIGFAIILDRNTQAGRNPMLIFYRRIFFMLLIGLAHLLLLWEGDIIFLYAVIALFLPLFRNISDRALLLTSCVLIFLPVLSDLINVLTKGAIYFADYFERKAMSIDASHGITDENYRTWLAENESYRGLLNWLQGGFFWRYEHIFSSNRIPKVLAMFLIGMVAGRNQLFARLEENRLLLTKIRNFGFGFGLPLSALFAYCSFDNVRLPDWKGLSDSLLYAISVIPLSLGYVAAIALMWLSPVWKQRLKIFAPVGRMALTNYISQTIIAVFIYYGIGLGMGGKVGPAIFLLIAIVVYIIQVIGSNLWFRFFRYGPLEWIWRMLTYGKFFHILTTK